MLLITNSKRAKPTPSFGILAKPKAISGLPTFIMILHGGFDRAAVAWVFTEYSRAPWYTKPDSPSAHETVTTSPSRSTSVAFTEPTIAGIPNSRAIIAAWQVRPPRLVTSALARFMTGSQLGSVMSATNTSPGCTKCISAGSSTIRTGPTPIF